jgi:hypothetical protein
MIGLAVAGMAHFRLGHVDEAKRSVEKGSALNRDLAKAEWHVASADFQIVQILLREAETLLHSADPSSSTGESVPSDLPSVPERNRREKDPSTNAAK